MFVSVGRELTELNRLGESLDRFLLELFGEPIVGAKFRGFYEIEGAAPSTSYPDPDSPLDFIICIPKASYSYPLQLHHMIAHEKTHGLWPIGAKETMEGVSATMLNEGLCEMAGYMVITAAHPNEDVKEYMDARKLKESVYDVAMKFALDLVAKYPEIIKDVRKIQPHVNKLTIEDFEEAGYTSLDRKVMEQLLSPMPQQF